MLSRKALKILKTISPSRGEINVLRFDGDGEEPIRFTVTVKHVDSEEETLPKIEISMSLWQIVDDAEQQRYDFSVKSDQYFTRAKVRDFCDTAWWSNPEKKGEMIHKHGTSEGGDNQYGLDDATFIVEYLFDWIANGLKIQPSR